MYDFLLVMYLVWLTIGLAVFIAGCKVRMPKTFAEGFYGFSVCLLIGPFLFVRFMRQ